MSQKQSKKTDIMGIVTLGFVLLLVGMIFVVTPNLIDKISDFFLDFELQEVAPHWQLPAPKIAHPVLYNAILQFCLVFAVFQIAVLGARFILRDPIDKTAGTISSIVFWFGASWILNSLILETVEWVLFLGLLIMLIGISIVIKNSIVLIAKLSVRPNILKV